MNPYRRKITVGKDGLCDVYDVLAAFSVTCPATQHAIKKLLLPGVRTGGKSRVQDLEEAVQAIQRAVELSKAYTNQELNCPPKGAGENLGEPKGTPGVDGKPPVYPLDEHVTLVVPPRCKGCGRYGNCVCIPPIL